MEDGSSRGGSGSSDAIGVLRKILQRRKKPQKESEMHGTTWGGLRDCSAG